MVSGLRKKDNKKQLKYDYFQNKFVWILKPLGLIKKEQKDRETKAKKQQKYNKEFNKDHILKSKVINVKDPPDTKDLIEVSDLYEIKKIAQSGNLVSKYENDKQTIYFTKNYYFVKKK